jgi:hypothetical protein
VNNEFVEKVVSGRRCYVALIAGLTYGVLVALNYPFLYIIDADSDCNTIGDSDIEVFDVITENGPSSGIRSRIFLNNHTRLFA